MPNDVGDADGGANNRQNFPVLSSVTVASGNTTITGTLNSTPNTTFRLELFANPAADPSGFGEATFLGFTNIITDAGGNASFTASFANITSFGPAITATATNLTTNDTSEFSAAIVFVECLR